jgi:transketolase
MQTHTVPDHELLLKCVHLRKRVLEMIFHAGNGHTGGSLSCLDILAVLYFRVLKVSPKTMDDPARDRYIQSKGHSVEALYAVLAERGFFPKTRLQSLCRYQSPFVGHPTRKVPGIEMNTGALGHGLSIAVGLGLAEKMDRAGFRVFTLLGDGELAEGSNWEAAMAAAHYKLDNLTAILDYNTLQITGRTRDVCDHGPIDEKFRAFGWTVRSVNGHDLAQLTATLRAAPEPGKPTCIVAHTVKGKGVSFMENSARWHHGVPTEPEMRRAIQELDALEEQLA